MGYPRDLEDYSEAEIAAELRRRYERQAENRCDYCAQKRNKPPCKEQDRHLAVNPPVHPDLIDAVLDAMAREVATINAAKGWHDDGRTFGDDIALLHSEASEALEAFRDWGYDDATKTPEEIAAHYGRTRHGFCVHGERPGTCAPYTDKPVGVGSEFADVLIRLLDTGLRRGVKIGFEYRRKVAYNRTRPYKHGGRVI